MLITDSKYVVDSLNKWLDKWIEHGFKDNRGKPIINELILRELYAAKKDLDLTCTFTKGHADDPYNIDQTDDIETLALIDSIKTDEAGNAKFRVIEGKLYYIVHLKPEYLQDRLFVPLKYRKLLMALAHDDPFHGGHLGIKKTNSKLTRFFWPSMNSQIESYVRTCDICQHNKTPKSLRPGLMQIVPVSRIFEKFHIDIVGPLTVTYDGNKYIVTAFSRFGFAEAVSTTTSERMIQFVGKNIICKFGLPKKIVSDNGKQLVADEFRSFADKLKIQLITTTDYHPQSNGLDERYNGSLVKILRNYVAKNQKNWDKILP